MLRAVSSFLFSTDRESVKLEKPDRKGKKDDGSEAMATGGGFYGAPGGAGGAAGGGGAGAAGAAGF